jgi:hypothetical protein
MLLREDPRRAGVTQQRRVPGREEAHRDRRVRIGQRRAREVEQLAARVDGVAARLSGRRLAVLVPRAGEEEVRGLTEELQPDASIAVGCAAWSPGDSGDDVVARASSSTRARVA